MKKIITIIVAFAFISLVSFYFSCKKQSAVSQKTMTIVDSFSREVTLPQAPSKVICSGSGCLRLLTYLQCQDKIVAVDSIEVREQKFDARPYALANPQFKDYPLFGNFRGQDNPELILGLDPIPDVIFKTYSGAGSDPDVLQQKTGIPVVSLDYGDLGFHRENLYHSLKIMGKVMNNEKRSDEIINYINNIIADLQDRCGQQTTKKTCYVGGIAYRGPHGFQSTEPAYPPFKMVQADNVAFDSSKSPKELAHCDVAKEMIIQWDPEIIFIDLSTLQSDIKANALYEIKNDPLYKELGAVKKGDIYGLLPYNWYTKNFGSILANAYFIGKILYPEQFKDVDPAGKADEIYQFLTGKKMFATMSSQFGDLAFKKL